MVKQVIVLGAGRPHRGSVPSALRTDRGGISVLEWLVDAVGTSLSQLKFVGGYGVDAIRAHYPQVDLHVVEDWQKVGSAASLLASPLPSAGEALVVYSDVMVRPQLVDALRQGNADITVAWDSEWRQRYAGRRRQDLAAREKVVVSGTLLLSAGPSVGIEEASGEFLGFIRLSEKAVEFLARGRTPLLGALRDGAHVSELIESLRLSGMTVDAVDARGDWAEIDDPGDIARFVLGTKADSLARVGRLVKHSRVADQVTRTVRQWETDPERALESVAAVFGDRRLIVRSSTTHEDAFTSSNAGGFTSVLGPTATDGLLDAVAAVIDSYRRAGIDAESQQVLVQPLIEGVVCSGVVLTRTLDYGAPWYVVEFAEGEDTEAVTSGSSSGTRSLFAHRSSARSYVTRAAAASNRAWLDALLDAVIEVESLLAHDALDIEFAIDRQGDVHLLQVRPAVTAMNRARGDDVFSEALIAAQASWDAQEPAPSHLPGNPRLVLGVMPDWNPAEIIGTAPGRLASDLYRYLITDEVWATQRAEAGYRDVRPAPLLVDIAGRPYVDVRASFASFLPASLDEGIGGRVLEGALNRLVANPWLHDKVEFSVMPTCVDPDWSRWEHELSSNGLTASETTAFRESLREVTSLVLRRVESDLATVARLKQETDVALVRQSDPLVRAAIRLDRAKEFGTLPFAHLARAAFVAVSLLRGARAVGAVSDEAVAHFQSMIQTVSGDLTNSAKAVADGLVSWEEFVNRWGHLRPGTYEITSPRYSADVDRFLRPLLCVSDGSGTEPGPEHDAWRSARPSFERCIDALCFGIEAPAVERLMRRAIEGREWAKLEFTRNLSDALEEIAEGWERRGVDRSIASDAPLSLLLPSLHGHLPDPERVRDAAAEGRERRELTASMPLPALVTDRNDLAVFLLDKDVPNYVGTRTVIAPTVNIENDSDVVPSLDGRIVLIPRADPGYDWIFAHRIAGLVTLYGGANSHMAIRCAEHGLPAAIGVGERRYRSLVTAAEIEIDPLGRTLRNLR